MTGMFIALLLREIRLSARIGGGFSAGIVFFLTLVTIIPFAIGPDLARVIARIEQPGHPPNAQPAAAGGDPAGGAAAGADACDDTEGIEDADSAGLAVEAPA
jgi:hypothetical protein